MHCGLKWTRPFESVVNGGLQSGFAFAPLCVTIGGGVVLEYDRTSGQWASVDDPTKIGAAALVESVRRRRSLCARGWSGDDRRVWRGRSGDVGVLVAREERDRDDRRADDERRCCNAGDENLVRARLARIRKLRLR